MSKQQIKVFISYAHDDEPYFKVFAKTIKTQLKSRKNYEYVVWDDSQINIGSLWDDEIKQKIADSDLAILCISDSFLASDYIKAKEFGILIKKFPKTVLAPLLLSPCEFNAWDDLAKSQLFKPRGDNYDEATNEDFAFADLVRFNKKNGDFIPNVNIDRYIKDFIAKIEESLTARSLKTIKKNHAVDKAASNYITNNYPYFEKDSFFGREELLKEIDNKIKTLDVPLLLSGIGGMGKTVVAIAYGKDPVYNTAYDYIAWVDVTENIFSNLFSTFHGNPVIPFEYSLDGDRVKDIAFIMQLLKQAPGNNLLLVDNANDETDLRDFVNAWKKYQPGWKCMLTTRCDNNAYKNHLLKLQVISLEAAEDLFKQHNNEEFDKESFKAIYEYIGGHTFLIELLAKFGQESSTINSTKEILGHLKAKSIKALNKTVIAKQGQQQETDKLVSEFVLGLYNPLVLPEKEQEYLRYFSILPVTENKFKTLVYLFGIKKIDEDDFDNLLNSLFKKGWLIRNANFFKCHQIIKEICNEKLKPNSENCDNLIIRLWALFKKANTTQAVPYFEMGLSVIDNIKDISLNYALLQSYLSDRIIETGNFTDGLILLQNIKKIFSELKEEGNEAICLERIGMIYRLQGNRDAALNCFKEFNNIIKFLSDKNPENAEYKNSLGMSFSKLGDIYQAEGNTEEALTCYKENMKIIKSLSDKNPEKVEYKNNLAFSFSRLGEFYEAEGDTEQALNFYKEHNNIVKSLSDKNPENAEYKNSLAISFSNLGNIYHAEGNMEETLSCYKEDMKITKSLSDKNPEKVEYKNNLAISFGKLGDFYEAEGDTEEALNYFKECNNIIKSLSDKNPENLEYKNNLAVSVSRLGDLYADEGKTDEALDCYRKYNLIEKELSEKNPGNIEYKKNLAISFSRLGDLYSDEGKTDEALDCYGKYNLIVKELSEKNPGNIEYKKNLAYSYANLANVSSPTEAKEHYTKAKEIWEKLVVQKPQNADYKKNLERVNNILKGL